METIKRIRALSEGGVLADIFASSGVPEFRKYNLLYGFNGSGKSTLSRMFGVFDPRHPSETLPPGCSFEFEMTDGQRVGSSTEEGPLKDCVCVFNVDFVKKNLRWADGKADSIFYIGEKQASAKTKLAETEAKLEAKRTRKNEVDELHEERKKNFGILCRDRARQIATSSHLVGKKYEAGQLRRDYETFDVNLDHVLEKSKLRAYDEIIRRSESLPKLQKITFVAQNLESVAEKVRNLAGATVGALTASEFKKHPEMVEWIREGHDFHKSHDLESCLFCGEELKKERLDILSQALEGGINKLFADIEDALQQVEALKRAFLALKQNSPQGVQISHDLRDGYSRAVQESQKSSGKIIQILESMLEALAEKKSTPTIQVEHSVLSATKMVALVQETRGDIDSVNSIIEQHNNIVDNFLEEQGRAQTFVKNHFLAEGHDEYQAAKTKLGLAIKNAEKLEGEIQSLQLEANELKNALRTHGAAADDITASVAAYLGHGELKVVAADEGYKLHRYGHLVEGAPSEGEQTAIALCYFLSTLKSEGRQLKNVIVVVDDPVSSLDTKAMNYACALLRTELDKCAQIFIFTHNQACMNEFKKAWKRKAKENPPTASLSFLDVGTLPEIDRRVSSIIEMPTLLREHDSEYHYLCHLAFRLQADEDRNSPHILIMPNVIRRILEIFLAFKRPGAHGIKDKIESLCNEHNDLDRIRMRALERLAQVESHSDNLDDIVSHSSMTIEETYDANLALLALMEKADPEHFTAMRRQCGL